MDDNALNLKSLMVDTKEAWVPYPEMEGFDVLIANLGRERLVELRKACMETKFDRSSRQQVQDLNERKFVKEFTKETLKDWKGLKLKYLEHLMLVDLSDKDKEEELPYSQENAELLVTNSSDFDGWLNSVVFDLDNFRSK